MLIFSNNSEAFVLKTASYLGAFASALPLLLWINGRVGLRESLFGSFLFAGIGIAALLVRRNKTIEIQVSEESIEVRYPFKDKSLVIRYDEIQRVNFSDLGMSLSISLKNGKSISFGSTIHRQSGEFSVGDLGPGAIQGRPGERLRLKHEIESWMTK